MEKKPKNVINQNSLTDDVLKVMLSTPVPKKKKSKKNPKKKK